MNKSIKKKQVEFKVGDSVEIVYTEDTLQEVKDTVGSKSFIKEGNADSYLLENGWFYPGKELKLLWSADICNPVFNPYVKDPEELTQAELQFLTNVLTIGLREFSGIIQDLKEDVSSYWNCCDASNSETSNYFNKMNALKTDLRKSKEFYKKLSEVQRKLKKQAGK